MMNNTDEQKLDDWADELNNNAGLDYVAESDRKFLKSLLAATAQAARQEGFKAGQKDCRENGDPSNHTFFKAATEKGDGGDEWKALLTYCPICEATVGDTQIDQTHAYDRHYELAHKTAPQRDDLTHDEAIEVFESNGMPELAQLGRDLDKLTAPQSGVCEVCGGRGNYRTEPNDIGQYSVLTCEVCHGTGHIGEVK